LIGNSSGFGRSQRLYRPGEFDQVLRFKDVRKESGPLRILVKYNDLKHARLGLIVPKRWVKKAHERNRCKRIVREHFRRRASMLPAADIVVMVVRTSDDVQISMAVRVLLDAMRAS
jgi:ribonuclease P protein component